MTDEDKLKMLCHCMGFSVVTGRLHDNYSNDIRIDTGGNHIRMADSYSDVDVLCSLFFFENAEEALKALLELSDREHKAHV